MAIEVDGNIEKDPPQKITYSSTAYEAASAKRPVIIYGTGDAPTPTGYPDGCFYLKYEA